MKTTIHLTGCRLGQVDPGNILPGLIHTGRSPYRILGGITWVGLLGGITGWNYLGGVSEDNLSLLTSGTL